MSISGWRIFLILFYLSISLKAQSPLNPQSDSLWSFHPVVKKIIPSVVSISTNKLDDEDTTSDVHTARENLDSKIRLSSASGFLISPSGHIVTNTHTIKDAFKINVELSDQRKFNATLIGADKYTEIAVLKINAKNLPYLNLETSGVIQVGDWVLAFGNPLRLRLTVTAGIVSAIGRNVDIISNNFAIESFIQTDAAINPGNSGGPLCDLNGKVVGLITAIASETGYAMGYGFAIPSEIVRTVAGELIKNGYIERPFFGAAFLDIDEKIRRAFSLQNHHGVIIDDVFNNSPAEKAGLRELDILLAANGKKIIDVASFQLLISDQKIGAEIEIDLIRAGNRKIIKVNLDKFYQSEYQLKQVGTFVNYGIELSELTDSERRILDIHHHFGILIKNIDKGSEASIAGLRKDDVLIKLNGIRINQIADYTNALEYHSNGVHIFKIQRADQHHHFFIQANEN